MTPEEISFIREWAKSGNNPIPIEDLGSLYHKHVWTNERPFFARLNSAGLTIASQADEIDRLRSPAGTLLAQSLKREREAKADAWDEGYRADAVYVNGPEDAAPPSNPYRKTEQ